MLSKELIGLSMREALSGPKFERKPELAGMADTLSGADLRQIEETYEHALQGVYHYNALAASRLVPANGLVLDLGSGTGQFARLLAQRRPDVKIIGVESSKDLLNLGQAFIAEQGLTEQVSINEGIPTDISKRIPSTVDMITWVMSIHQSKSTEDLLKALNEISLIRIRCGSAVWLFDFARPNLEKTAEEFPNVLQAGTPILFRRSCKNSLMASFSYNEMSESITKVMQGNPNKAVSKGFKIYQAYWQEREDGLGAKEGLWQEGRLSSQGVKQFREMTEMFPSIQLPKHLK